MPARARTSGEVRVRSRPSKETEPPRVLSKPMVAFKVVVLPTPLRPIRQTICPGATSRSTSRTMLDSPYATHSELILSIVVPVHGSSPDRRTGLRGRTTGLRHVHGVSRGSFLVLPQVDLDDLGIVLHFFAGPLA